MVTYYLSLKDFPCTELAQPNNGKAAVLNEATRLLKDLVSQIESLKKENASLLSESHYVRPPDYLLCLFTKYSSPSMQQYLYIY